MIKNETQYKMTKKLLKQFSESIEALDSTEGNEFKKYEVAAIKSQIEDLNEELCIYVALRSGHLNSLDVEDIKDIYKVLITGRIARGLTQKELGQKLGVAEQQIQRWESSDYESISISTMREILSELKINIPIGRVSLTPVSFNLSGTNEEQLKNAKEKVAERRELFFL